MGQLVLGLAAGIVVGLVMEWVVDWTAVTSRGAVSALPIAPHKHHGAKLEAGAAIEPATADRQDIPYSNNYSDNRD